MSGHDDEVLGAVFAFVADWRQVMQLEPVGRQPVLKEPPRHFARIGERPQFLDRLEAPRLLLRDDPGEGGPLESAFFGSAL